MLNRLMFVYFIQKKGFLDGDPDYLRNRLQRDAEPSRARTSSTPSTATSCCGSSTKGSAGRERTPELDELARATCLTSTAASSTCTSSKARTLRHDIQIPDEAFERLFDFFDALPLASRRAPAARRQRDQPRCARLHLREVHQPEADGGVLHQGGHHRVHRQEHDHPVPVRRRPEQVQGRLRSRTARPSGICLQRRSRPLHLRRRPARRDLGLPIQPPRAGRAFGHGKAARQPDIAAGLDTDEARQTWNCATAGTNPRLASSACRPRPGASSSPAASATPRLRPSSPPARSATSTT